MRLHIGGTEKRVGWYIVDIQNRPEVDHVAACTDLSIFDDDSATDIYASHVIEHLSYQDELPSALKEFRRVLKPGGKLRIGVPDLAVLCRLFIAPELDAQTRYHVMRVIMGGQMDEHDFHKVGLTDEFLTHFLIQAGFTWVQRVSTFHMFSDCTEIRICDVPISLNVEAR